MHLALCVAADDYGFPAYTSDVEVARFGDMAFKADEQPGAGKDILQFLPMEFGEDEEFSADEARSRVDHLVEGQSAGRLPALPGRLG